MKLLRKLRKMVEPQRLRRYIIASKTATYFGENSEAYNVIMRACDDACNMHRGKKRDNGEIVINHDRSLYIFGLEYLKIRDAELLAAIFLHDLCEDYPKEWTFVRVQKEYGRGVRNIVAPVTKPKRKIGETDDEYSARIFQRVQNGGIKAIILKCIDRLHNMLTLWGSSEKKVRKIYETLQFLLPIATKHKILVYELTLASTEQLRRLDLTHPKIQL